MHDRAYTVNPRNTLTILESPIKAYTRQLQSLLISHFTHDRSQISCRLGSMAHSSKSGGTGTTFRLGHEDRQGLEERAAAADQTLSEYLRELVREHLEPTEMGKLLDEVEGLRIEVRMLREDMQFVLETLLINVANIPEDQVKSAVRAKLKRP